MGYRDAYEARLDTLLTDQVVGVAPLPANLSRMDRNTTPRLVKTGVLYALHWEGDPDFPESMRTGPFVSTAAQFAIDLSYFMPDGTLTGSVHYQVARRALQPFFEKLRHRIEQPANWDPGVTHAIKVDRFRMVGRGAIKREPYRLQYTFGWDVVFDEEI